MRADHGDVVLSWLTKVVASLAVLGLAGFDGVSLVAARFSAADHAQTAATAAADAWSRTRNVQQAYDAAAAAIATSGDSIETTTFTVAADGAVHLTLHRQATTLLLHRVPALRSWLDASETARGRPAP